MKHYQEVLLKAGTGLGIQGAAVRVTVAVPGAPGTGALAALYKADAPIPANVKANPTYTNNQGEFDFYVPNGSYDLTFTRGSASEVWADVEIYDFSDVVVLPDNPTLSAAAAAVVARNEALAAKADTLLLLQQTSNLNGSALSYRNQAEASKNAAEASKVAAAGILTQVQAVVAEQAMLLEGVVLPSDLNAFYTKAQVDQAIAAAVAGLGSGGGQPAPVASIVIGAGSVVLEGNSGTATITMPVTRSVLLTGTSSVAWAVTGTGANPANAADFGGTFPSGTVNFAAGESVKNITFLVAGDAAVEPDETLLVTLSNPVGAVLGNVVSATATITNDDSNTAPANDIAAPSWTRTSGPTAYPVTGTLETYPQHHVVGDILRIFVSSSVAEAGGLLAPSGTTILNDTIILVADPAANNAAINAKLASISNGIGFVFVRPERGALIGAYSIPVQYGTAAVPAITSPLAPSIVEGQPLSYNATTAAPVAAIYIVGQDGDRVEFVDAKPGSSFSLRFVGGITKTFPADDYNTDNVYDIGFEVVGLNGVRSAATSLALTLLDLDLEADQFNFADVSNVALNAKGESPTTVTVAGLTPGYTVPLSVGAGTEVQINGGAWGTSGNVQNDDTLKARVQTPAGGGSVTGVVNYGGKGDSFRATNTGFTAPLEAKLAEAGSGLSISADGFTATRSSGGDADTSARGQPYRTNGYFEVSNYFGGFKAFGVANSAESLNTYPGSTANSAAVRNNDSAIILNNVDVGSVQNFGSSTVTGVLVKNGKLYFVNGSGWTGDPVAETGGVDIAALGPVAPFVEAYKSGASITVNLGASAFTYTRPAGSPAWNA